MGLILLIALFSVLFIADVVLFSLEKYEFSIAVMLASLVGIYFLSPTVATFVHGSWLIILTKYLPAFLVVGLIVAVGKWIQYNFKRASTIGDAKTTFDEKYPVDVQILQQSEQARRSRVQNEHNDVMERYERGVKRGKGVVSYADGSADVSPPSSPPAPLVFEPIPAEEAAANRREKFVEYYKQTISRQHKTYSADFKKASSVVDALTPRAKDNVGLITIWIFQWPIVIVDTLITDLLIKLGKHAARLFDAMFSYFSRKLVAHATKGL